MNIWLWLKKTFGLPEAHRWTMWKMETLKAHGFAAALGGEEVLVQRRQCITCGLHEQRLVNVFEDEECSGLGAGNPDILAARE